MLRRPRVPGLAILLPRPARSQGARTPRRPEGRMRTLGPRGRLAEGKGVAVGPTGTDGSAELASAPLLERLVPPKQLPKRRPSGAPPPLPHHLRTTGLGWLV